MLLLLNCLQTTAACCIAAVDYLEKSEICISILLSLFKSPQPSQLCAACGWIYNWSPPPSSVHLVTWHHNLGGYKKERKTLIAAKETRAACFSGRRGKTSQNVNDVINILSFLRCSWRCSTLRPVFLWEHQTNSHLAYANDHKMAPEAPRWRHSRFRFFRFFRFTSTGDFSWKPSPNTSRLRGRCHRLLLQNIYWNQTQAQRFISTAAGCLGTSP